MLLKGLLVIAHDPDLHPTK